MAVYRFSGSHHRPAIHDIVNDPTKSVILCDSYHFSTHKRDVARPRAAGACHPLRRAQPRPRRLRPRLPQLPRTGKSSEREPGNHLRCRELAPVPSLLALHLLRPHSGHRPPATARERRQRVRTAGFRLRIVNRREGLWSPDTHDKLFPRAASGRFTEGPMREAGNDIALCFDRCLVGFL